MEGFEKLQKKKAAPITEGGIKVSREEKESLPDSRNIENLSFEEEHILKDSRKGMKEKYRKKSDLENILGEEDNLSEISDLKTQRLIQTGENFFGKIEEQDIELDFANDKLKNLDESENSFDSDNLLITGKRYRKPFKSGENRLKKMGLVPEVSSKTAVEANNELLTIGKTVVKKGAFGKEALKAGLSFMKKVDKWAGRSMEPSDVEKDYYNEIGTANTLHFLYVDGRPLKEFVKDQYGYRGSRDPRTENATLSAYVAMISARQNHAVTMVRPTFKDGHADVDIRNLSVNMESFIKGRSAKVKFAQQVFRGEEYRKYCETAYRSETRAESVLAACNATGHRIEGLQKIDRLMHGLKEAGKGKHSDYDDFVWAFTKYYDALFLLASEPSDMQINRATLDTLDSLNSIVSVRANAYLKGKKMNLPRHNAVKEIRDLVGRQAAAFVRAKKSGAVKDNKTISLGALLDWKEEGFVVMGIEDEISDYKRNQQEDASDKNEYRSLPTDMQLSATQRTTMQLKNTVTKDAPSTLAYKQLLKSENDPTMTDDARIEVAKAFLASAARAIWAEEKYRNQMNTRYPYAADNTEMMFAIIARTQLTKIYANEFKRIPALPAAMEMWNEEIASREAEAMTYQNNTVGKNISREEFNQNGGSSSARYVTVAEAQEINAASHGFLAGKEVKGHPGIVKLVPSLPEFVTVNGDEGEGEVQVPLRKTYKTLLKTLVYMSTNADGHVKTDVGEANQTPITEAIDQFLRYSSSSNIETQSAENFLYVYIYPEMKKMLEEEYRQKGVRGYKTKAHNDTVDFCDYYMKIFKACGASLISSAPDVSFNTFVKTVNFVKDLKIEDIMNYNKFGNYTIDGKTLTAEEIGQALDDFKQEMEANEAEFVQFRNMDTDDVEVPGVTSCNDNAQVNEVLLSRVADKDHAYPRLNYELKDLVKKNPDAALDILVSNLDNIIASGLDEKHAGKHKQRILELDQKRKTEALNKQDLDDLKDIYISYVKYDWHRGANLGKVGNAQYTSETMAPLPNEMIKSPLTNKVLTGKYISDKEMKVDDENGTLIHESMNSFYNHDNAFSHCKTHKDAVKCAVKDIIRAMVDKL